MVVSVVEGLRYMSIDKIEIINFTFIPPESLRYTIN
jgi:hypothetical protein